MPCYTDRSALLARRGWLRFLRSVLNDTTIFSLRPRLPSRESDQATLDNHNSQDAFRHSVYPRPGRHDCRHAYLAFEPLEARFPALFQDGRGLHLPTVLRVSWRVFPRDALAN